MTGTFRAVKYAMILIVYRRRLDCLLSALKFGTRLFFLISVDNFIGRNNPFIFTSFLASVRGEVPEVLVFGALPPFTSSSFWDILVLRDSERNVS